MQLSSLLANPSEHQQTVGDPFLHLRLAPTVQATLSMQQAVEALVIPSERLNPMPNMPPWVMGVLNQRTRLFWVIDLPQLLKLPSVEPIAQGYSIVILREQQKALAIAVPEVIGVLRFNTIDIVSPIGNVDDGLVPYLQGCLPQETSNDTTQPELIWVLDPSAILQRAAVEEASFRR